MSDQPTYPYRDGDVAVLGPEIFASADGMTISWKGANYSRHPGEVHCMCGGIAVQHSLGARVSAPQTDDGAAERRDGETGSGGHTELRQLTEARETIRRLNRRAQQLESELATYRRAVRQWEVSERGTYIPHASLRAIGQAAGTEILGSVRHLKHFERIEQAEAALRRVRALRDDLRGVTGARWIADSLDSILNRTATIPPAHDAGPTVRECADADRRWPLEKHGE